MELYYLYIIISMRKILKPKPAEPLLQPWQHQQQISTSLNHTHLPMPEGLNPQSPTKSFQDNARFDKIKDFCYQRRSKSSSHNRNEKKQYVKNNPTQKNQKINYVKKNQQNLQSYYCMTNYSLLNDDTDQFVPLNPNSVHQSYVKRPFIHTTYIGYYEQKPFFIESPAKKMLGKQKLRKKSSQSHSRPYTSDATISHQSQMKRLENQQSFKHFNQRATLSVGGCHLQKMLKIKQKLRQKLKRNSQKKDIERGLYVKNVMKIQEQQTCDLILQSESNSRSRTPTHTQIRKSSSKSIGGSKEKVRVDKWKQYIKLKASQQNQSKLRSQNDKNKQLFGVVGGAIYR